MLSYVVVTTLMKKAFPAKKSLNPLASYLVKISFSRENIFLSRQERKKILFWLLTQENFSWRKKFDFLGMRSKYLLY